MAEHLIPIYSSLDLATATGITEAVLQLRQQHKLLPLAIVVLDAGGNTVSFRREDGCGVLRHDIARGKAWGALGMGMATRQIRDRLSNRPTFQAALSAAADGRFIPTPGGVLILNAQGMAIGAVGISGDASDKDEFCAIEAIKMAGLQPEPPEAAADWNSGAL
jgi:glc operon protein GlcG